MTQKQSFGLLIAHALIALALIAAASLLAWQKVLDASAVTAIFGAVIGFAGGAGIAQGAAIINGGPKPDWNKMYQADPELLASILDRRGAGSSPQRVVVVDDHVKQGGSDA